mmetsp:Transcript_14252/g.16534  ORF Transcript_14252/g.16534 Transcript_14252/m.16534 type:complete len:138 (-) Transcript_14252:630-1043(-)|eukprot:CAMPEP_0204824248 /NCGR_PEP_ID=MMETSP1346-20131115/2279_1 /ASSEMBLY_ACC=CAM_ASM_000771 /TAXON_ID=215587 /ORGANISM="Aplanochytrium stocchinoi, Strain GSBS06" /LENGTH=137 /DNA_ID=CAMNT_0051951289 /DNA_START=47 /DNA_END=460 /DNA_ORIENTATION=-
MNSQGQWLLRKLAVRYCQHGGSSRGMREFIRSPEFIKFAEKNPQIEVTAEKLNGKHPACIGTYINAPYEPTIWPVRNYEPKEILDVIQQMRDRDGGKVKKYKKPIYTVNESIQGIWEAGKTASVHFTFEDKIVGDAK